MHLLLVTGTRHFIALKLWWWIDLVRSLHLCNFIKFIALQAFTNQNRNFLCAWHAHSEFVQFGFLWSVFVCHYLRSGVFWKVIIVEKFQSGIEWMHSMHGFNVSLWPLFIQFISSSFLSFLFLSFFKIIFTCWRKRLTSQRKRCHSGSILLCTDVVESPFLMYMYKY